MCTKHGYASLILGVPCKLRVLGLCLVLSQISPLGWPGQKCWSWTHLRTMGRTFKIKKKVFLFLLIYSY